MITHKQYPNHHIFETEIGGRTFTVETGKVAELCNAEAICRYGDTVVLVTAVASPLPKAGIDYFPLTIEVEERMYAVGRIPGSFFNVYFPSTTESFTSFSASLRSNAPPSATVTRIS